MSVPNRFQVGMDGLGTISFRLPFSQGQVRTGLVPSDALLSAASLVAIAEPFSEIKFAALLSEVKST